jgi:transcriptional regulator with XRE-family HTH domain
MMNMNAAAATAVKPAAESLGQRVRYARQRQRLTLAAVAEQIGCSESLLSKIERDRITPTLPTLFKLAEALGTSVAALFSDQQKTKVVIYHQGERPELVLGSKGGEEADTKFERIIPYVDGRLLDANVHVVPPGGGSSGAYSHLGEEVGFVMEGFIELSVDGCINLLKPGSSFFFNSSLPHSYRNIGTETAKILWVNVTQK